MALVSANAQVQSPNCCCLQHVSVLNIHMLDTFHAKTTTYSSFQTVPRVRLRRERRNQARTYGFLTQVHQYMSHMNSVHSLQEPCDVHLAKAFELRMVSALQQKGLVTCAYPYQEYLPSYSKMSCMCLNARATSYPQRDCGTRMVSSQRLAKAALCLGKTREDSMIEPNYHAFPARIVCPYARHPLMSMELTMTMQLLVLHASPGSILHTTFSTKDWDIVGYDVRNWQCHDQLVCQHVRSQTRPPRALDVILECISRNCNLPWSFRGRNLIIHQCYR